MNNDKEQITSNEKSEDVLADLSKDEHSGEETSSPESSGKKTFTDTDGCRKAVYFTAHYFDCGNMCLLLFCFYVVSDFLGIQKRQ